MTLTATLNSLPELELASLNFSSGTQPDLIHKTFDQYCEYKKTPKGVVLAPIQPRKWLVVFCDEINLPASDQYGTQTVIMTQTDAIRTVWTPSGRSGRHQDGQDKRQDARPDGCPVMSHLTHRPFATSVASNERKDFS